MTKPLLLDLGNHDDPAVVDAADAGLVAEKTFYLGNNGYVYYSTWENGKSIPRTLHSLPIGPTPGRHIDHRNHDKLDNRRCNLRVVSPQRNQVNRKPRGTRGIGKTKLSKRNPWRAQIMVNRKGIHLGMFPTYEDALAARIAAEIKYYGEKCPR